jgi:hypothetical protein
MHKKFFYLILLVAKGMHPLIGCRDQSIRFSVDKESLNYHYLGPCMYQLMEAGEGKTTFHIILLDFLWSMECKSFEPTQRMPGRCCGVLGGRRVGNFSEKTVKNSTIN